MKEVSMRTLKIMDKVDYSRWEKAYEKYPKLTEIILIFDNPAGCDVAIGNKLNELLLCTEYGLNFDQIKHVANPNFSSLQMQEVRLGFEFGLDLEDIMIYAKPEFGGDQMRVIRKAIQLRMSEDQIKLFADPKFKRGQMQQIVNGFLVDCFHTKSVEVYADPKFGEYIMSVFREALHNVDVEKLAIIKSYDYTLKEVEQCIKNMSDYPYINLEYWKVLCNLSPVELTTFHIIKEANEGLSLDFVNALVKSNYSWECLDVVLTNYKQFSKEEQELLFTLGSHCDVANSDWIQIIVDALKEGISIGTIMSGTTKSQDLNEFNAVLDDVRKNKRIQRLNQLVNKKTE